jgi:O-antigen/teichoic acid export membrane protein
LGLGSDSFTPAVAAETELPHDDVAASVARGGLWSIGWQGAGLAAALIATPFTIRLLGPSAYGVWALLQTTLTWIALADVGMSLASTRFAGDSLARGDDQGEVTAVWTSVAITAFTTTAVCAIAAWFAPAIVAHLLHVHGALSNAATLGLRVMTAAVVATALNNTFNTPQVVRLRWFSNTLTTTGSAVLQVILVPVALWAAGGSVQTAAFVAAGTSVLGAAGTVAIATRLQPGLRRPQVSARLGRSILGYGAAASLSGAATVILTSAERLFLGHYAGVVTVAVYVVASRLGTLVSAIPVAASAPLFPAIVRFHAQGAESRVRDLYAQALQGSFLVLTPAMLLLAGVAGPFLTVWAGHLYGARSTHVVYVVIVGVWFNSLTYMPQTYLLATSRAWLVARVHLLEVVPYLIAAALLTSRFGAMGAAIVWSGRGVIDALILFVLATRSGRLPLSPLSSRRTFSLLAPVLLGMAVLAIGDLTGGLAARAGALIALTVVYAAITWWLVLTTAERAGLVRLGARIRLTPRARRGGL